MPRFVLILTPERTATGALSIGDAGRRTDAFARWLIELGARGALLGGARVRPCGVRLSRSGRQPHGWRRSRASGVSACLLIEAEDLDAAVESAASCPGIAAGSIEVLESDHGAELGSFGAAAR